ncbi:hypothetical protein V1525DRAFT_261145 [Lipomyces kononenkoae]|uniref:Uncharacterized protein n=1 Tax=Lipomyces kononenkoae TaxID=34357 RepID=A0ACC3T7K3_LIPKO
MNASAKGPHDAHTHTQPPPPHMPPQQSHTSSLASVPPPSAAVDNGASFLGFSTASWQGSDESLRHALAYRTAEEQRRAEEERTKQEEYRLELRKKDLELLKEGIRYGVPPDMLAFIFIGNGVTGETAEWIREYVARIWRQNEYEHAQTQDARYDPHHHRSKSAQAISSLSAQHVGHGLAPPPPAPLARPPPPPSLPSLVTGVAGPASSTFSPQEQSPVAPPHPHSQYPHRSSGAAVTPPLQVLQNVKSPSPPPSQPTIQFHHWQPNSSGGQKDKSWSAQKESLTSSTSATMSLSSSVPAASQQHQQQPPPLGNGIPRSPTRSILNPAPEETISPKRRRQTLVFDTNTSKPTHQLHPTPRANSPSSPSLGHPSLPPISSLSSGPNIPRRRGAGHARHRSEATLHGYEPYLRPQAHHQLTGPAMLNPNSLSSAASVPRGGHPGTEPAWEAGSVGVLAAAAESELRKEMMAGPDHQSSTDRTRSE